MRALKKNINGNRFAKCAIQTALLDIQAQRLDLPLSEVLGGRLRDSLSVLLHKHLVILKKILLKAEK